MTTQVQDHFLQKIGITRQSSPQVQAIGVGLDGQPIFADSKLVNSRDPRVGTAVMALGTQVLDSLGVLHPDEKDAMLETAQKASNPETLASIDSEAQTKNRAGFQAVLNSMTGRSSTPELNEAADVYFASWDRLSPAQKSLAVANYALYQRSGKDGKSIGDRVVPATEGGNYEPLTAKKAVGLVDKGYNIKSLINNWETLNDIHALAGGHSDPEDVADLAAGQGLLGSGDGQVATNVTADSLAGTGWAAAPHLGVGAVVGASSAPVPANYSLVADDGRKKHAVPSASIPTVAAGGMSGSLLNTAAGHGGVSDSAQELYSKWPEAHKRAANHGTVGGSAMVSGLYGMSRTNPLLFSSTIAASFGDKGNPTSHDDEMQYLAHIGTKSLDRLTTGERSPSVKSSVTSELGKIGPHFNPGSFSTLAKSLRASYAAKGIKSKADAYGLANQAFAEKRINAVDLVGMQKTFNMLYDPDGMKTAKKLLMGREKGGALAKTKLKAYSGSSASSPIKGSGMLNKTLAKERNKLRYQSKVPAVNSVGV